jgi:glycosyltransferase involved in cell wall biosynthesis
MKKVSIIVPVYNAEKYLVATISSIINQSYSNFELILIDDGAKDSSPKICDDFADSDSRVKVIHQKNAGIGAAQNAGLEIADGEYITFADNDDLMSPYLLSRLVKILEDNDADMSAGGWLNIGASKAGENLTKLIQAGEPNSKVLKINNPLESYQNTFSKVSRKLKTDGEFHYFGEANWCKLYKKEIWDNIRFPLNMIGQDMYIANELYLKIKSAAVCLDPLYIWVQRGDSVTHTLTSKKPASYYFDLVNGSLHNLKMLQTSAIEKILPARTYYATYFGLRDAKKRLETSEEKKVYLSYKTEFKSLIKSYSLIQRFKMHSIALLRNLESTVYFYTIYRRR